jgi:SAM-dependent methyltransferase
MNHEMEPELSSQTLVCHLCHSPGLDEFTAFRDLRRVTSDCRPWPAGGRLCLCPACGSLQKVVDAAWQREVDAIYASYHIYHQAEGAEQAVFEQSSGAALPRSLRMLDALNARFRLPQQGRMLDVGCGNGATLGALHQVAPRWSLAGFDLDAKYRSTVEAIGGVEALYTCPPDQIPGSFDLITMVHVLEHIADPGAFLRSLRFKLAPRGLLLVEVPDHTRNPFELLIADHCTHFTAASATKLMQRAGYELAAMADDWVPRELSLVATRSQDRSPQVQSDAAPDPAAERVTHALHWLKRVAETARELAGRGELGLFGTSIAATWLYGELAGSVGFFVDEDRNRVGKKYLDLPVYHPSDLPRGSQVFMPMPPSLAESICRRLDAEGVAFHRPPAFQPILPGD